MYGISGGVCYNRRRIFSRADYLPYRYKHRSIPEWISNHTLSNVRDEIYSIPKRQQGNGGNGWVTSPPRFMIDLITYPCLILRSYE